MTEFKADQFQEAYANGIEAHYWSRARNMILRDLVRAVPVEKWLEVGCGPGIVVNFMRQNGLNVDGVELANVDPVCEAVVTGTAAGDLPGRSDYDGLMLLDVIEHIEDATAFLAQMHTDVPNARNIIVAVPARQEIWSNYDERFGHFRRYTRTMLRSELEQAGWTPDRVFYGFRPLYPAALALLALKGKRDTATRAPAGKVRLVHTAIASVLYVESKLPLGLVPGTSVFATARR